MKHKEQPIHQFNKGEPFIPPPLDVFIDLVWWSVLEATFALTEWPKYDHFYCDTSKFIPPDTAGNRHKFIIPSYLPFNLKSYNSEFQQIFCAMNEDINDNKLEGRRVKIEEGIYHLVRPYEVILWAIKMQRTLPLNIQEVLSIRQIFQIQEKPWQKKVKVMIVSQYYKLAHPNATKNEITRCDWMKKYALNVKSDNQYRQLQKDYSQSCKKGSPGRPKKDKEDEFASKTERLKMIPEVIKKKGSVFECDFFLLDSAISTAVNLISFEIIGLENICGMNLDEFMNWMLGDKLIKLYLKNVPQIIEKFIKKIITKVFGHIREIIFWNKASQTMCKMAKAN